MWNLRDTPFAKERSTTLQVSGLNGHAKLEAHNLCLQLLEGETKWRNFPITKHVELVIDVENGIIISIIENMFFVSIHDLPSNRWRWMLCINKYNIWKRFSPN